jgi:hypothetical protein
MKRLTLGLLLLWASTAAASDKPGLVLRDSGRGFMNAMAALSTPKYQPVNAHTYGTGFWLEVYTPESWIALHKMWAAEEYREFTDNDVTDEMREPVLRVVVHPDIPGTFDGQAMASSVKHAVVRSTFKEAIAVQPLSKEPFAERPHGQAIQTVGGAVLEYSGVLVTFPLDAVLALRDADKQSKGEFIITVIGESEKKDFKVKTKHFERLPGLQINGQVANAR